MTSVQERQMILMMMLVAMGQNGLSYQQALHAVGQFRGFDPGIVELDLLWLLGAAGITDKPQEWLEEICGAMEEAEVEEQIEDVLYAEA